MDEIYTKIEFKKVRPVGKLFSQGRGYFLLNRDPIVSDSWQSDGCDRWACVPDVSIGRAKDGTLVYPVARHVVTNAYAVEYANMPEITIRLERFGLDEQEIGQTEVEPDPSEIW